MSASQRVESRLDQLGLSQSDLALRLGVSTGAVSRWLSGERTPSLEMAFRLEQELGVPAEDWLEAKTGTDS